MITIHTVDLGSWYLEFTEPVTVAQVVQKIKEDTKTEIRGSFAMQETKTGRTMAADETLADGRIYYLTAWFFRHGHPLDRVRPVR